MDLVQHGLRIGALLLSLGAERVQKTLVFPGREQAALHAQLFHGAGKTETIHEDTNAADDAGLVHEDFIGSSSDVVSRRGTGFFHHRVHRLVVLGLEAGDFVIDDARLHRAAPWGVDQQDHRLGALVFEGTAHGSHHKLGARLCTRGNFTLDVHHRCMRCALVGTGRPLQHRSPENGNHQ